MENIITINNPPKYFSTWATYTVDGKNAHCQYWYYQIHETCNHHYILRTVNFRNCILLDENIEKQIIEFMWHAYNAIMNKICIGLPCDFRKTAGGKICTENVSKYFSTKDELLFHINTNCKSLPQEIMEHSFNPYYRSIFY